MFVDNNTSNALKNKIVKEIEDKLNANPIPNDLKASEFFKLSMGEEDKQGYARY